MTYMTSIRSTAWDRLAILIRCFPILPAIAKAWQELSKELFDPYRPELHYMRGPGPKWREKHGAPQTIRAGVSRNLVPPTW
jgi:hypothetical protein